MTPHILIFAALVFALVLSISLVLLNRWRPDPGRQRLALITNARHDATKLAQPGAWQPTQSRMLSALLWLSPWMARLSGGDNERSSALRLRFAQAGWRSPLAAKIFFTCKTLSTAVLAALTWAILDAAHSAPSGMARPAMVMLGAAMGYYLPDVVLKLRIQHRQLLLMHAFPDAMDLLRLCVQAGLGLDAAIERVGREMRQARPVLSKEFALTGMALRAGASRADALRHLSQRVGLKDIDALVVMLIQADRFGTSVSESLQVYSDALRTQRRLRAEEAAAKLPVKLLIPLIFCVFPSLLTVLLGPVKVI